MVLKIEVLRAVPIPPPPPISMSTTATTNINTNDKINNIMKMKNTNNNNTTTNEEEDDDIITSKTLMEYQALCFPSDFTLTSHTKNKKNTSPMSSPAETSSPVSTITTMFDRTTTKDDHHHHVDDQLAVISDDDDNDNNGGNSKTTTATPTKPVSLPWFHGYDTTQDERERISRNANIDVTKLLTAREVRDKQRYTRNPYDNNNIVRLVSGCVPILNDGRILLISSRKEDSTWSLPKGGWELDECIEEGAIRETFEEAGVTGTLGPCILGSFLVQSGKNKRKKISASSSSSLMSSSISSSSLCNNSNHNDDTKGVNLCDLNTLIPFTTTTTIRDEEPSSSSTIPSHTHTCVTFFPLYVQQIMQSWPENTRQRKAFPIDGTFFKGN